MALVLERRREESILIDGYAGGPILVTVTKIRGDSGRVRLAITAPEELRISRLDPPPGEGRSRSAAKRTASASKPTPSASCTSLSGPTTGHATLRVRRSA
jgi:sRNA-binding carbon storage regulator CsrA